MYKGCSGSLSSLKSRWAKHFIARARDKWLSLMPDPILASTNRIYHKWHLTFTSSLLLTNLWKSHMMILSFSCFFCRHYKQYDQFESQMHLSQKFHQESWLTVACFLPFFHQACIELKERYLNNIKKLIRKMYVTTSSNIIHTARNILLSTFLFL